MVAYSFKYRFVDPIRTGHKPHTIRNDRKRHARPGEIIQLYIGMRTKACKLIGTATCLDVRPIRLDFDELRVEIGSNIVAANRTDRDRFARSDGFVNWTDLVEFWRHEHDERNHRDSRKKNGRSLGVFSGVIIRWKDFADHWERTAA